MILRARVVLPITGSPIENGAVEIRGARIGAVGNLSEFEGHGRVLDLGDVMLMPGLINAHCHLDYTHMAGEFAPPRAFTDWLKLMITAKSLWTLADYAASWQAGAQMLVRNGVTSVADIEVMPDLLPNAWNETPLRVHSFFELIGITGRRSPAEIVGDAVKRMGLLKSRRSVTGLSPHAPYSTLPALLKLSARTARKHRWQLCVHVAESEAEYGMFTRGKGPMFDWIKRTRVDMSDCGKGSPVAHLAQQGVLGPNLLAVHANYLGRNDPRLLAESKTNVVHCPRSHAFFQHDRLPIRRLRKAGVNICLGTDSLASVFKRRRESLELDMFEEMRSLQRSSDWLRPAEIVEMATINGARALGREGKAGELRAGTWADVIAVPFSGRIKGAWQAVIQHRGPVAASMINGKWTIKPKQP